MNYKPSDLDRYFKSPDQNIRCVLLYGTNEGMIADLAKKFVLSVAGDVDDAFLVSTLDINAVEKDVGLLFGEYQAASLMGGRRVVVIKDANNNLTKPLKELFESTSSDTLLVMTSTTLNTKSSLVSFVKDAPFGMLVGCYDDRKQDILSYVRSYFISQNITIASDAFELLCQRLSMDRKAGEGELEKLTTYIGSKKNITRDDVKQAVSDTAENSMEDMCYAAALGKMSEALHAYQFLLHEGEEPVQMLRQMTYHYLRLLEAAASIEKGSTADGAAAALRPPVMWFRKSDFVLQLKIWQKKQIFKVLALLYDAEKQCKQTGKPTDQIGEYALMQIASAAKKLKAA
ncbi:MAG: DNA polymerase III subunit delta [Alphaproteobacteria bacterium]|nr:DNA polymerase III subunit delta [Alphaproteobacteria bacterium]